jgi:hypothetical protein
MRVRPLWSIARLQLAALQGEMQGLFAIPYFEIHALRCRQHSVSQSGRQSLHELWSCWTPAKRQRRLLGQSLVSGKLPHLQAIVFIIVLKDEDRGLVPLLLRAPASQPPPIASL